MTDKEKITLLQRYFIYFDSVLIEQIKQSEAHCSSLEDFVTVIELKAKFKAYKEIEQNINKILYAR